MAKPAMYDIATLIKAGLDPKTGAPTRIAEATCGYKAGIAQQLAIVDEQDAVNRYVWFGLPRGITGNMIERILYYKGRGMLFYMETENQFYFLPFALSGGIDVYGRYLKVTPVPMGSTSNAEGKVDPWIKGLEFTPYYDIVLPDDDIYEAMTEGCVILNDYTNGISQDLIPRSTVNKPVLDIMADMIPFMRTALMNSTGVEGMRVGDESEKSNVAAASLAMQQAALRGEKWIPIVGQIDFQALTKGSALGAEEYLLALQALDNYRLSLYGMDNGGLFQKRSHMLEAEQRTNSTNSGIIMDDGLVRRQEFADIANSIWGSSIVVEVNETLTNTDINGDGLYGGFGQTEQPATSASAEQEVLTDD